MKSLGSRFARWSEDYLHRVSKALVQEGLTYDCTHIAFEKLKHIRERISNASKFQQWAFRRIQEYTEYKILTPPGTAGDHPSVHIFQLSRWGTVLSIH